MTQTLDQFHQAVENHHQYAQDWKTRTGGKTLGYLCTLAPEEILYAAGILPVRILGAHEPQDATQSHIFSMFCSYCQDTLAQGLLGRYAYLEGIVFAHCCPHIRQTYESWKQHIPTPFSHLLWVPSQTESPSAHTFFTAQVQDFKEAVEKWTGAPISPAQLRGAIETYNLNRRLLLQAYGLRKEDPPAISGTAMMEIVLSSALMDKKDHNRLLQELLSHPVQSNGKGIRLMVLGSENDDVELLRLIESLGAVVVMEDNCIGNRYFMNEVSLEGDPVKAIADRYLDKPPCPLRDIAVRRRANYLLDLAKEYRAEGAIFLRQKFCDPHAYEVPFVSKIFQEQGLPNLVLELDATVPHGQYRTRVEAFMEMLQ